MYKYKRIRLSLKNKRVKGEIQMDNEYAVKQKKLEAKLTTYIEMKEDLEAKLRACELEHRAYISLKEETEAELKSYSEKSSVMTLVLTFFPISGLHRITNGKILSGIVFACTAGGLFIWWIVDMITIARGKFTDQYGRKINTPKVLQLGIKITELEEAGEEVEERIRELKRELNIINEQILKMEQN